jgi:phage baseplate assembly protein W
MADRSQQITLQVKQKVFYRDFDRNLSLNNVTGELVILENANAVMSSVENLVMTYPGERFYHAEIGSNISQALFDLMGYMQNFQEDLLQEQIVNMLATQEPRAKNVQVTIETYPQDNYIEVTIQFSVINIANQVFSLPIIVPLRG